MATELIIGVGGAAGDGGASTGDTLAQTCARLGLHVYVYTSYQSLIRGGHSWIRLRVSTDKVTNVGDQVSGFQRMTKNNCEVNPHMQTSRSRSVRPTTQRSSVAALLAGSIP